MKDAWWEAAYINSLNSEEDNKFVASVKWLKSYI